MQLQLRFKDHDLPLFSDSAKRWTTNGPSLYEFIRQVRQELCCSLEEGVLSPGYAAHQAIQAFVAAVTGWLTPADHSMTLTLVAGLSYNGDSTAAADVDNLVCVAVRRWDQLEGVIAQVEAEGKYDRSLCEHDSIMQETGFLKFDPATNDGRTRIMQLRRLVIAYFKVPASVQVEIQQMKDKYMGIKQTGSMRQFITLDDQVFKQYVLAGGDISGQTRIEWMKQKLSGTARKAMEQHCALLKNLGQLKPGMETDWLTYSDVLMPVCADMVKMAAEVPAAPAAGQKKKTAGRHLENEQVTAIHRYAASSGVEFREVSLEEVEGAPGGVEKYKKMTSAEADKEYKDSLENSKSRLPLSFPILLSKKSRGAEAKLSYKQAVQACLMQTREL